MIKQYLVNIETKVLSIMLCYVLIFPSAQFAVDDFMQKTRISTDLPRAFAESLPVSPVSKAKTAITPFLTDAKSKIEMTLVSGKYSDPQAGVEITFPDGWKGQKISISNMTSISLRNDTNKITPFIIFSIIDIKTVEKIAGLFINMSSNSAFLELLKQSGNGCTMVTPHVISINGMSGMRSFMQCPNLQLPISKDDVLFFTKENIISLQIYAMPVEFDKYDKIFNSTLNTIKIRDSQDISYISTIMKKALQSSIDKIPNNVKNNVQTNVQNNVKNNAYPSQQSELSPVNTSCINSQGVIKFCNTMAGGGVTENRIFKKLPTALPSSKWTADFDYNYTTSSIPAAYPLSITSNNADPEQQGPTGSEIIVYHGDNSDVLHLRTLTGSTIIDSPGLYTGIPIFQNHQYYVRLVKTPTELTLSVFSDPGRTIQISGSPITLAIAPINFNNLNFIQHSTSFSSGSGRTLTAEVDNMKIYNPSQILFKDDYSSTSGWTQVGTSVFITKLENQNGIQQKTVGGTTSSDDKKMAHFEQIRDQMMHAQFKPNPLAKAR